MMHSLIHIYTQYSFAGLNYIFAVSSIGRFLYVILQLLRIIMSDTQRELRSRGRVNYEEHTEDPILEDDETAQLVIATNVPTQGNNESHESDVGDDGDQTASDAESVELQNMEPDIIDQEIAREEAEINRLQTEADTRIKREKLKQLRLRRKELSRQPTTKPPTTIPRKAAKPARVNLNQLRANSDISQEAERKLRKFHLFEQSSASDSDSEIETSRKKKDKKLRSGKTLKVSSRVMRQECCYDHKCNNYQNCNN